ncbi:MAG: 30S ribosomal protein S14 [Candidatus Aenigmatarchaeota archaeon]|nr:MAG: 30S ribosomal protein S14 [Candidatus Aenigmarchaeota archaeon]
MSFENAKKQILNKPVKLAKFLKHNRSRDRKFGRNATPCRRCGKTEGVINKYGLRYCRQCFREEAKKLGFKKYS